MTRENSNTASYTATIGFFDGVHIGHQYLLGQLNKHAAEREQKSLVISFDQHPRKVLNSDFQPKLLTDNSEKESLILQQGIKHVEFLHFTPELAKLTADEFMEHILKKKLNVNTLLMGYDHRFGCDQPTSISIYQDMGEKLGIDVILQKQHKPNELHISSSTIRQLISDNKIEQANKLLGRPYSILGTVIKGYGIGRKIGFPTANIEPNNDNKLIPPSGVYEVNIIIENKTHQGMLNIGHRPTIHSNAPTSIEVHIFNFSQDIYKRNVDVKIIRKIREELKFNSIDELTEQIKKDKENILKHA